MNALYGFGGLSWFRERSRIAAWLAALMVGAAGCQHVISVKSDPEGALVSDLARGELGETGPLPLEIRVDPGDSLNLTFNKTGFPPVKKNIENIRASSSIMVELFRTATVLTVVTQPAGTVLEFLDRQGRKVPFVNITDPKPLDDGHYSGQSFVFPAELTEVIVRATKQLFEPREQTIRLVPRGMNRCTFALNPCSARITLLTEPEGAEVYERQLNFMGTTPVRDLELSLEDMRRLSTDTMLTGAGHIQLRLTFRKEGFKEAFAIQPVGLGRTNAPLTIKLEPK